MDTTTGARERWPYGMPRVGGNARQRRKARRAWERRQLYPGCSVSPEIRGVTCWTEE